MATRSPNGRFEIIVRRTDDDSYFYSDTDYSWYVTSVQTGDELASFFGHSYQRRSGTSEEGVDRVEFSDEGDAVIATHYDGTVEQVDLPAKITLTKGGRAILLTYKGGREETRPRRAVIMTTKYGQPIVRPLVDDPDRPEPKK